MARFRYPQLSTEEKVYITSCDSHFLQGQAFSAQLCKFPMETLYNISTCLSEKHPITKTKLPFEVGDSVYVPEEEHYCRAEILKIEEDEYVVDVVDFGGIRVFSKEDIHFLNPELCSRWERIGIHIVLKEDMKISTRTEYILSDIDVVQEGKLRYYHGRLSNFGGHQEDSVVWPIRKFIPEVSTPPVNAEILSPPPATNGHVSGSPKPLEIPQPEIRDVEKVFVSINHPGCTLHGVQPSRFDFTALESELQVFYGKPESQKTAEDVQPFHYVVAKYGSQFCRAFVLSVDEGIARIIYTDYGAENNVPIEELFELTPGRFTDHPWAAITCSTDEKLNYEDEITLKIESSYKDEFGLPIYVVKVATSEASVSDQSMLTLQTTRPTYPPLEINEETQTIFPVATDDMYIGVQFGKYTVEELLELNAALTTIVSKSPPAKFAAEFAVKDLVAVAVGSGYYRGLVCKIVGEDILVYQVDFGAFSKANTTTVRQLPPQFINHPPIGCRCLLKEDQLSVARKAEALVVKNLSKKSQVDCVDIYEFDIIDVEYASTKSDDAADQQMTNMEESKHEIPEVATDRGNSEPIGCDVAETEPKEPNGEIPGAEESAVGQSEPGESVVKEPEPKDSSVGEPEPKKSAVEVPKPEITAVKESGTKEALNGEADSGELEQSLSEVCEKNHGISQSGVRDVEQSESVSRESELAGEISKTFGEPSIVAESAPPADECRSDSVVEAARPEMGGDAVVAARGVHESFFPVEALHVEAESFSPVEALHVEAESFISGAGSLVPQMQSSLVEELSTTNKLAELPPKEDTVPAGKVPYEFATSVKYPDFSSAPERVYVSEKTDSRTMVQFCRFEISHLNAIRDEVKTFFDEHPPSEPHPLSVGDLVVCTLNDCCYRAEIMDKIEDMFVVACIDDGFVVTRSGSQLTRLPKNFEKYERVAGVLEGAFPSFQQGQELDLILSVQDGKLKVGTVQTASSPRDTVDYNESSRSSCLSIVSDNIDSDMKSMRDPEDPCADKTFEVKVTAVHTASKVCVVKRRSLAASQSVGEALGKKVERLRPVEQASLSMGSVLVAQLKTDPPRFRRARIIHYNRDTENYKLFLVDTGLVVKLPLSNLFELPAEFCLSQKPGYARILKLKADDLAYDSRVIREIFAGTLRCCLSHAHPDEFVPGELCYEGTLHNNSGNVVKQLNLKGIVTTKTDRFLTNPLMLPCSAEAEYLDAIIVSAQKPDPSVINFTLLLVDLKERLDRVFVDKDQLKILYAMKLGAPALAFLENDPNPWQRARVVGRPSPGNYKLLLVDMGIEITHPVLKTYKCPTNLLHIPETAVELSIRSEQQLALSDLQDKLVVVKTHWNIDYQTKTPIVTLYKHDGNVLLP